MHVAISSRTKNVVIFFNINPSAICDSIRVLAQKPHAANKKLSVSKLCRLRKVLAMSCDSVNGTGGKKMGWVPPSKDCCNPHRLSRSQRIVLGIFCIGTLVSLCFGILIAFAIMYNSLSLISQLTRDSYTGDPDVTGAIFDKIDQESLEEYVQWIARDPHTAGQRRDTEIAIWIRDLFRKFNLDHISESQYQVLLSYPDPNLNNVVELLDASGNPLPGVTTRTNPGIRSSKVARNIPGFGLTVQDGLLYPYHAYSPSGEVEDSLVYVNYAREADFLKLRELNVQVQGRIVIARDGMIYRGDKVANAQEFGAKGLILYPDPEDVAMSGTRDVFPGSWWLPGNGVQYGSVLKGTGT